MQTDAPRDASDRALMLQDKEAVAMIHNDPRQNRNNSLRQKSNIMRKVVTPLVALFLFAVTLPFAGYSAEPTYPISTDVQTTRERTVRAVDITGTAEISITAVSRYDELGYSHWEFGAGLDYGALLPDGSAVGAYNSVETLLTYFSISDTHITDKESPAQGLFFGVPGAFGKANLPAYSPVMLYTTQVLDAAVQTINALHHTQTPFDFGIGLGDPANSNLYNGLRWHIDVLDGKRIVPSSGTHKGAGTIDYQKPFQAAGLDKSIPWYQIIGNHDQYWQGALYPDDYARSMLTGNTVINMGLDHTGFPSFDARGIYMGVIDGSTPYGEVIDAKLASTTTPPIVAADRNRRALTTATSTSLNWMKEFFNTTSKPKGHGFTQENLDRDFVSYTFEPKAGVPVKFIVLDDTCKQNPYASAQSYSHGCLDQERYDWLVSELDKGQVEGKLMVVAAHVPVGPQLNVPDAPVPPGSPPNDTVIPMFFSTCVTNTAEIGTPCPDGTPIANNVPVPPYNIMTDAMLLDTLHNYPNLILWMAGHRHINTVTPQPAPAGKGPEYGFWEVETPSTRDFPQGFRTFAIKRNDNNTVSIRITTVDPAVQGTNSPALTSRGYAIAAYRIANGTLTDTASHVYNAELIKPLAAPYNITVNVAGPGTVRMGPYQADTCTAGHSCQAVYLPGTQVALTPTAASGAVFAGWSACTGTSTCNIAMSSDLTVTATFTQAPTTSVTPAYRNFGNVKIGRRAVAAFTVKNTKTKGTAALTIASVAAGQTDGGQFAVVAGSDKCSGKILQPGRSCTFQASFAPSHVDTRMGTVIITSDDPASPAVIQLTGVGK